MTELMRRIETVLELAQDDRPREAVPGYWVPAEAINMLAAEYFRVKVELESEQP